MKAAALITRQTRKVPNVGDIRGLLGPGRECSTAKPVAIILDALRRRADGADAHAPFVDGWLGLVRRQCWGLRLHVILRAGSEMLSSCPGCRDFPPRSEGDLCRLLDGARSRVRCAAEFPRRIMTRPPRARFGTFQADDVQRLQQLRGARCTLTEP